MPADEASPLPALPAPPGPADHLRAALRESEEAYRRLFELNPLPMWVRDATTLRFRDVNRAALATYGHSREEFLAMTVEDIRPPEERARFRAFLARRDPAHPESYSGRWIHLRKDRTRLTVEVWSHDLIFHGRPARLVIARDLTDQLRVEEEARLGRERFQLIAAATSDAVWDWDFAGDTLWWGDSFHTLFGHPPGTFPPTLAAWAEAVHPEDRDRVLNSLRAARDEATETWSEEYRFLRGDGAYAQVLDRGRIVRDAAGRPHRMVGGMTDVTERNRLQSQCLGARRLDSIGALAGGVAHDLNNMLAPILLAVELLRTTALADDARRYLAMIETSARRSADLVRQVLAFARGVEVRRSPVQPRPLLLEAARFAGETFPRHLRLHVEAPADLWTVQADPTQLSQVLLNLSLNARDALPDGGRIVFAAANIRIDEATASAHPGSRPGPHVMLSVSDTGAGIAPQNLDRVFEPFFTTKEIGQGTGLGLATVHAIAREHGGFVTVESAPGAGATFHVYLPASPDLEAAPPAPDDKIVIRRGGGQTILLIDDEPALRDLTRHILEHAGYSVLTAGDGAEGVALFAQHRARVAVVITDMAMPIMDGATTVVALHRIDDRLPIIATSGHDPDGRLARGVRTHLRHFLPKPYAPAELLAAIADCLPGPAAK